MKTKAVTLSNPRTGELWVCENFDVRRRVDGVDFVEVHRPDNNRMVWMNLENLVKVKEKKLSKTLEMNSKQCHNTSIVTTKRLGIGSANS